MKSIFGIVLLIAATTAAQVTDSSTPLCCTKTQRILSILGVLNVDISFKAACTLEQFVCDRKGEMMGCLKNMLPNLTAEILNVNETLTNNVSQIIPTSEFPELCTDLNTLLQGKGIQPALDLVNQAEQSTIRNYTSAFVSMYCNLNEQLFDDMKTDAEQIIKDYNDQHPENQADESAILAVIDDAKTQCLNISKTYFNTGLNCYKCTAYGTVENFKDGICFIRNKITELEKIADALCFDLPHLF